jgi:AcrR family transcriptional regulator
VASTGSDAGPVEERHVSRRPKRRSYNSPKREQQSARTRQRIIEAGAGLVHEFTEWNWKQLTYRAVGARAGVSERTVYRHFPTDDQLKNAVMQHLVREAGVDLRALEVEDFGNTVAKIFSYLSSFAIEPARAPDDPAFLSVDSQRRQALLASVTRAVPDWSPQQRETAAAALDIFWNLPPFERLVATWGFDLQRATATVQWITGLIEQAMKEDRRPPSGHRG